MGIGFRENKQGLQGDASGQLVCRAHLVMSWPHLELTCLLLCLPHRWKCCTTNWSFSTTPLPPTSLVTRSSWSRHSNSSTSSWKAPVSRPPRGSRNSSAAPGGAGCPHVLLPNKPNESEADLGGQGENHHNDSCTKSFNFFPFFILYRLNCFHLWGQWVALIVNIISTIQIQWFFPVKESFCTMRVGSSCCRLKPLNMSVCTDKINIRDLRSWK